MNYPYLPNREPNFFDLPTIVMVVALILLVFFFFFSAKSCRAEVVDLNIIATIESHNNPLAVSRVGAIGTYQIMPCVLSEYNTFNKTNLSRSDLFSAEKNEKIAKWYLEKRIPQMLRHYGKEVTTENCLISYNAGIRAVVKGYLPRETKNYLLRYAKLQKGSV